jgi:hypothetical protein
MGQTRIQDMTRAQALREIKLLKEDIEFLRKQCNETPGLKVTWDALESLEGFRKHKNYHVRVQAWKAQGAPMPRGKDHNETVELTIKLAQDLQPNQVARYFAQQDVELKENLAAIEDSSHGEIRNYRAAGFNDDSAEIEFARRARDADEKRAKGFSDVMKQQFCVSLLAQISGQGMVV